MESKGMGCYTGTGTGTVAITRTGPLAPGLGCWLLASHPTHPTSIPEVLPSLVWPRIRHNAREQPVVMAPVPDVVDFPRGHSSTLLILPQGV